MPVWLALLSSGRRRMLQTCRKACLSHKSRRWASTGSQADPWTQQRKPGKSALQYTGSAGIAAWGMWEGVEWAGGSVDC